MSAVISDDTRREDYVASASQTVFPFSFEIIESDELQVYQNGSLLTEGTDYTVASSGGLTAAAAEALNVPYSGDVTLVNPASVNDVILIFGDRAVSRATDFATGGTVPLAERLNSELNSLTILIQQVERELARTIRADLASVSPVMQLPSKSSRAGKYLRFTDPGGDVEMADLTTSGVTLSQSIIAGYLQPQTDDEDTAGVTAVNLQYVEGCTYRYQTNALPGMTDMTQATKDAVAVMEVKGGGDVCVPPQIHLLSDKVAISGPVWLRGAGASFEEIFTASPTFAGSVFKLKDATFTSASKAIIEFDYTGAGGEQRLHAGASNILVFGNRGSTADPSDANATDNNSFGIGFHIKGARYVTLDHCFAVWCAEDGVKAVSDGTPSNNVRIVGGGYMSNADDGIDWSGGDSFISHVQCGYNGGDGLAAAGGLVMTGVRCWDNFQNGSRLTGDDITVCGGHFYDNQYSGILMSGGNERVTLVGPVCQDNGKDTGQSDNVRSGVYVTGTPVSCVIAGLSTGNKGESGTTGQRYGLRINDEGADIVYLGVVGQDNGVALISDVSIASELTIASGAITIVSDFHRVDTESDAATDDLDTINGGYPGRKLLLKNEDGNRNVVLKHGTGNLSLNNGRDVTLDTNDQYIELIYLNSTWYELYSSAIGKTAAAKTGDTSRSSTSTLAADPDLAGIALRPNAIYQLHAVLQVDSASPTPDFKFDFSFTDAPQSSHLSFHAIDDGGVQTQGAGAFTDDEVAALDGSNQSVITINGTLLTNATDGGSVSLRWAQNNSNANAVDLKATSFIDFEFISDGP